ncbi:MAG: ribbon-helix-helix protein, CopG family [Candidatus Gastranaerophilales bacterium]|jgi:hypothetical protein|nr:ribbon-helix-helix protein, CopG family [Candidatus Gastranaerophilales bacterium]
MKKKKMKNFRLSDNTIGKLEKLCELHGISQTEVVARAIELLYDAHKKKENQ